MFITSFWSLLLSDFSKKQLFLLHIYKCSDSHHTPHALLSLFDALLPRFIASLSEFHAFSTWIAAHLSSTDDLLSGINTLLPKFYALSLDFNSLIWRIYALRSMFGALLTVDHPLLAGIATLWSTPSTLPSAKTYIVL